MADVTSLTAEPRERTGKGGARALRREGKVPAIIYGGKDEPQKIALFAREVGRELSNNPRFFSTMCELTLGRKKLKVIPRDAQLHPVNDKPLHLDFYRASKGATITIEVPVNFLNEEASPGLKQGGVLNIVRREIELICPVESIPGQIDVDLGEAEIGDSIHISQVSLPEGVELTITDRDFTICGITTPSVAVEADEGEDGDEGDEAEAMADAEPAEETSEE